MGNRKEDSSFNPFFYLIPIPLSRQIITHHIILIQSLRGGNIDERKLVLFLRPDQNLSNGIDASAFPPESGFDISGSVFRNLSRIYLRLAV